MKAIDIIRKKRDGLELTKSEIDFLIDGYTNDLIPDYQMSALLMAIYFQKMSKIETVYLTQAIINSGERINLDQINGIKVDKHSTGGVGDKTTIALAPIIASLGAPLAKMSGRGLGHTGGTLDKLEAIPGLSTDLEKEDFIRNVNESKIAIAGQTGKITPADKKLYALRDVTATVDNISLIASSIMSKKLASGADAIVLDVKTGSGAFMKSLHESFSLAKEMVDIGNEMGKRTLAVITDMDQPLGNAVGNSLEVIEAIESLKGNGPSDFYELCVNLGVHMLILAEITDNIDDAKKMIENSISNGSALRKLEELIENQGGNPKVVNDYSLFKQADYKTEVKSIKSGYIKGINAEMIGRAALAVGAGRETKESKIDLSAGIILNKKIGDMIDLDESLAVVHHNDMSKYEEAKELILSAYIISSEKTAPKKLIHGLVLKDEIIRF